MRIWMCNIHTSHGDFSAMEDGITYYPNGQSPLFSTHSVLIRYDDLIEWIGENGTYSTQEDAGVIVNKIGNIGIKTADGTKVHVCFSDDMIRMSSPKTGVKLAKQSDVFNGGVSE